MRFVVISFFYSPFLLSMQPVEHTFCEKLISVVGDGDVEEFNRLLMQGASITTCDSAGTTVIHSAFYAEPIFPLDVLFETQADIFVRDKQEMSALHHAALQGSKEGVQWLIEHGFPIDTVDRQGIPASGKVNLENVDLAIWFLEHGERCDGTVESMLLENYWTRHQVDQAAQHRIHELAGMDQPAWLSEDTVVMSYFLIHEILRGRNETVATVLNNITFEPEVFCLAMFYAALSDHKECFDVLKKHGESKRIKYGAFVGRIVGIAAARNWLDVVRWLWSICGKRLLESDMQEALYRAALSGHYEMVSLLLPIRAECDDAWKATLSRALHIAAVQCHGQVVKQLLKYHDMLDIQPTMAKLRKMLNNKSIDGARRVFYLRLLAVLINYKRAQEVPITSFAGLLAPELQRLVVLFTLEDSAII